MSLVWGLIVLTYPSSQVIPDAQIYMALFLFWYVQNILNHSTNILFYTTDAIYVDKFQLSHFSRFKYLSLGDVFSTKVIPFSSINAMQSPINILNSISGQRLHNHIRWLEGLFTFEFQKTPNVHAICRYLSFTFELIDRRKKMIFSRILFYIEQEEVGWRT